MNKLILIISLFFCSTIAIGQKESDSSIANEIQKEKSEIAIKFPEKIQIENVSKENQKPASDMPWIAAICIGVLSALINIWIANKIKISNEKTIELQIDNAKELALTQLKANLGTQNRQNWIDELRHNLSELISNSALINVEFSGKSPSYEKISPIFKQMNYNKAKIVLLLNNEKTEQKKVIDAVNDLLSKCTKTGDDFNISDFKKVEDRLISSSSELFKLHWGKIKHSISNSAG